MIGISLLLVAAFITCNGFSEIAKTIENDKGLMGKVSIENYHFNDVQDESDMVPAREFTIGSLTGQSLAVSE